MKYLDLPVLTHLSASLSANPSPEARINVRFEAYSIKPVAAERKEFKKMEDLYASGQEEMEEMSFSPEMREAGLSSCFGRLDVKESRKVHFLLVSTLNSAFPDHDFSSLRPDHFTREPSGPQVLGQLSGSLLGPIGAVGPHKAIIGPAGLLSSPNSFSVGYAPQHNGNTTAGLASSVPSSTSLPNLQAGAGLNHPSIIRILEEVVGPLLECDVYSWLPEPEYDPHNETEEGEEASEDGMAYDESDDDIEPIDLVKGGDMDIDVDGDQASWGQAGMELDDVPESQPLAVGGSGNRRHRHSIGLSEVIDLTSSSPYLSPIEALPIEGRAEGGTERRVGGLLWSANYFFYSKRQKRILFLTCWCRKRPSYTQSPPDLIDNSFPLPISASYTAPSALNPNQTPSLAGSALRSTRYPRGTHNRSNARSSHRNKKAIKPIQTPGKSITSSTIPIRGMTATPTSSRFATSAPTTTGFNMHRESPSPMAAMARMHAGGFKPRQTQARKAINAENAAKEAATVTGSGAVNSPLTGFKKSDSGPAIRSGITAGKIINHDSENAAQRIRKERSESGTPSIGTSGVLGLVDKMVTGGSEVDVEGGIGKGKRVKV